MTNARKLYVVGLTFTVALYCEYQLQITPIWIQSSENQTRQPKIVFIREAQKHAGYFFPLLPESI